MTKELAVKHINGGLALALGSRPPSIEHQFLDQNGDPVDLNSGTWVGEFKAEQLHVESQPVGLGGGSISINVPLAAATYDWADEDFATIGRFRGIIWIGNGSQRYGSTVYEWDVADAPGDNPTV